MEVTIPSLYAVHMAVELRGKGAVRAGRRSRSGEVAPLSASSLPWTPLCEDIQWNPRLRVSIGLRDRHDTYGFTQIGLHKEEMTGKGDKAEEIRQISDLQM